MLYTSLSDTRAQLTRLIEESRRVTVFTGAGVSTECGVPDFRSPDSPWMKFKPIDFDMFIADPLMREEAWRRKFAMDDLYAHAAPGRGHRALAGLVASGKAGAIITQNIDNLHQASGVAAERVIELHGNGSYATCLDCGKRYALRDVRAAFELTGAAPECGCGGAVKSATISFGQAMPHEPMRRARQETLACDMFLVIGSSLVVYPAAGFPQLASENGATLVIINGETTPLDHLADVVLRGDVGAILDGMGAQRSH